jgi:predicted TIM-barrel fold metal-dependent hydrolase
MNRFPADAPVVDGYLALCARYDVPAVFHCDEAAPIHRAARRHPTVPVVLYHSGFGTDHEEAVRVVEESIRQGDARLYLETAQVEAEAALALVRRVGADRVLFGTDATYFGTDHYVRYAALVRLLAQALTPEEFAQVMRGNAERLFRLRRGGAAAGR